MNIRKLAKLAGTSYSTVSRALNDSPLVAEETRLKIKQLAAELGYSIDAAAQALATGIKKIIGILYPFHSLRPHESAFTSQAIDMIRQQLLKFHYDTLIAGYENPAQPDEESEEIPRLLRQKKVDGIIVFGYEVPPQQLVELKEMDQPFLLVNPPPIPEAEGCTRIVIDHEYGGMLAGQQLLKAGRKKLLCLTENSLQFEVRTRGFERAMQQAGGVYWEKRALPNGLYDTAYDFVKQNLSYVRSFDGLFVQSDISSIGVLNCLMDHGVSVPEEVSIIGFDDIVWAQYTRPRLTTIHQPREELASIAASAIIDLVLRKKKRGEAWCLKPVLVVRESCK